jgi:hypothetical protein
MRASSCAARVRTARVDRFTQTTAQVQIAIRIEAALVSGGKPAISRGYGLVRIL